jgi:hypothetical protein
MPPEVLELYETNFPINIKASREDEHPAEDLQQLSPSLVKVSMVLLT